MKLTREKQRELVWDALFKNGGDRDKAAAELQVHPRTLARYLTDLELHDDVERMGWKSRRGPPPGMPRGSSVIRMRIVAHVRKHRGVIRYGDLAKEVYGEDTPATRSRIYSALEWMKTNNVLGFDGEVWRELDKVG